MSQDRQIKTVVLLNSSFISRRKDYIQNTEPHLRVGIATMAACLIEKGIDVFILDPQAEKSALETIVSKIISFKPDYLGLPAYTEEINDAAKIAREVKRQNSTIITIIGGQHVTALPEETLKEFSSFDIANIGEGETTILAIINGQALETIEGIAYRNSSDEVIVNPRRRIFEDLNRLPFPAWHLYNLNKYATIPIEPLRGCPYDCIFCFRTLGREVRYKSPERIVEEIEHNKYRYGRTFFDLKSGTFPLSKEHAMKVFDGIVGRGLKIQWIASTRVNTLDEELLKSMKASGCNEVSLGIESGDPEILKQCGKNITPDMAENILKLCKKIGIKKVELNFILGLPHETKETLKTTGDFAFRMRQYSTMVNFAILTPFPGTDVYQMALHNQHGLRLKSRDWSDFCKQSDLVLERDNFKNEELERFQVQFYFSYYFLSPLKALKLFSFRRFYGFIKKMFI